MKQAREPHIMHHKHVKRLWATALGLCLVALFAALCLTSAQADGGLNSPFQITAHDPPANEVGVALTSTVQATFDDDVNASTVTSATFVLHGHLGGLASGTFGYDAGSRTVTLDPDRAFHAGEVLRVSATSGISNTGGAALAPYGWQFTAGPVVDRCAGGFTDIGAGLTGVYRGSAAWGDYDRDGDLDMLLTGATLNHIPWDPASELYRNDGGSGFTAAGAGLTDVWLGSVAWGDVDNDGDLDLLLTGLDSAGNPMSKVYRNDAAGSGFTDIGAVLTGVYHSSVAWGDYDNDGDLDILLTGEDSAGTRVSKVYRNDAAGSGFTDIGAALTGVRDGSVAWGDYDNDGDLDILLTGWVPGQALSKVYRNDGGVFTDIAAGLTGVGDGSVGWADYDNDGDLDILLTGGWGIGTAASKVYRNDGGVFTDIAAGLTGVKDSSVAWGDYDNDGDLDILLTGQLGAGGRVSKVYRNDGGAFGFTDIGTGLTAVDSSSVAWGDVDNDGDLDILLTGGASGGPISKVYRNADCVEIVAHGPQAHEVGVALGAMITATFDADIELSTVTSRTFVVHGHLGGLAGGTLGHDGGNRILTLDPDRAFHAGEVLRVSATSGIVSTYAGPLTPYGWQFTAGPVVDRRFAGFVDIGAGLVGVERGSVAWGDYDNDGDLDILLTGGTGSTSSVSKVYRNDGPSGFTDIGAVLRGVSLSSVAWGDYDNDGDLDILLTGHDGGSERSRVYRNDGGATFTDIGAGLTGVAFSSVAWGDYDNDGDLDILLTGFYFRTSGHTITKLYRNDGGTFTNIEAVLTAVRHGSVAWGDYDNDGDLDILLTGSSQVSKVYRNDGDGAFTDVGAGLVGVERSSVAWGDYDNDGDLDILLTGGSGVYPNYVPVSQVYRNDGGSAFTDIGAGLTGVHDSSAAWGDYDNDGDLDILLSGWDGSTAVSRVYRNDTPLGFTDTGAGLTGVRDSSVAWGDVDDDGDLDILLTGGDGSANRVSRVYRNNSRPELGSVTPASGSGPLWATTYFTTTWEDPDGWRNLKQCYFHIGASPSLAGNVTLLYNAAKDKLWLLDDSGTVWLGGCNPGQATIFWNSQAALDCSLTEVQGAGDTLGVRWAIEFKPGFEGTKKLGLKCKDRDKLKAKGKWMGTWTVTE